MKAKVETCADDLHGHAAGDSVLKAVARRLSLRLRDEDRQFVVHASIGIAVFPGDGLTGDELIRGADTAMYRARKGESCRVFFDSVERAPAGLSAARSQARERTTMKQASSSSVKSSQASCATVTAVSPAVLYRLGPIRGAGPVSCRLGAS